MELKYYDHITDIDLEKDIINTDLELADYLTEQKLLRQRSIDNKVRLYTLQAYIYDCEKLSKTLKEVQRMRIIRERKLTPKQGE